MEKIILIFGATGNQGGAVVNAMLNTNFKIRAVSRNPNNEKSKSLTNKGIDVVKADFEDEASLHDAMKGVYGVYSIQNFMQGGSKKEIVHGKLVANVAKKAGVEHFVYSSVGGAERNTGIDHFDSKWIIEKHIHSLDLPHTILRPVFFMENFVMTPPFLLFSIFRSTLKNKTLQLIATEDIGKWVALAFSKPDEYMNKSIEIAGDQLTYDDMKAAYMEVYDKKYNGIRLPIFVISLMGEIGKMFLWFKDHGYQSNLQKCKNTVQDSKTFKQWLAVHRKA